MDRLCFLLHSRYYPSKCCHAIKIERQQVSKSAQQSVFLFDWNLAMQLISPHLRHQHESSNHLRKCMQEYIAELLEIKIEQPPVSPGKRKRCSTCLDEIEGKDQKKKKDKLRKTVHRCMRCGEALCTTQFQKICPSCV